MVVTAALKLDSPVTALPQVGSLVAKKLERLGLRTVADLLLYFPVEWQSYGGPAAVAELEHGHATVIGNIASISSRALQRPHRKRMNLTEATLRDDQGGVLKLVWFNQPWVAKDLAAGQRVAVAGTLKQSRYGGAEMTSPQFEVLGGGAPLKVGGLQPKYGLTQGLDSRKVAALVELVLPLADQVPEVLPEPVRRRHRLLSIGDAIRAGHKPGSEADFAAAQARMRFAEVFQLQVAFLWMKREVAREKATAIPYSQDVIDRFKAGLGFELTHAQKRSAWETFQDMSQDTPMNRLLNGDVGSGKTAVAAAAVAMAHAAGRQSVVMAPTEILARQHLHKFRAYLEDTFPGLTVELLVSGLPAPERRRVRLAAASGHCALVVGTHALIEEDFELIDLGLAVVDEQHRFGTRQRELLRSKAGRGRPHFLAMTATPIPRSLALALYGEMALSIIDEMPPGRTPVETRVVLPSGRDGAYDLVRREVAAGHQAFVICPLIEESDQLEAKAATVEFDRLRKDVFPELRLSLVHGRMKDKDSVMSAFREGSSDILVATPVIEVGVDVPNATVMLIEGADRFGLAQLHQFRGRVGRSALKSHCLLLTDDPNPPAASRLRLVEEIHDGFELARRDMDLRGAGEVMGAQQHGMTDLTMEALRIPHLISTVREEADLVLAEDPGLSREPALLAAIQRRLQLTSIS